MQSFDIPITNSNRKNNNQTTKFKLPQKYVPYFNPLFFHLLGFRNVKTSIYTSSASSAFHLSQSGGGLYEWLFPSALETNGNDNNTLKYTFPFRLFLPLYYFFPSFSRTYRPSSSSSSWSPFFWFQSADETEPSSNNNRSSAYSYFQSLFASLNAPSNVEEEPPKPADQEEEQPKPAVQEEQPKPDAEQEKPQSVEKETPPESSTPKEETSLDKTPEKSKETTTSKPFDITKWKTLPDPVICEIKVNRQDLHPNHPRIQRHKTTCEKYGCLFVFNVTSSSAPLSLS